MSLISTMIILRTGIGPAGTPAPAPKAGVYKGADMATTEHRQFRESLVQWIAQPPGGQGNWFLAVLLPFGLQKRERSLPFCLSPIPPLDPPGNVFSGQSTSLKQWDLMLPTQALLPCCLFQIWPQNNLLWSLT